MRVLGFMTGTSLDACDMAILETDGENIQAFGPAGERKLSEDLRDLLLKATEAAMTWERGSPEPEIFAEAGHAIARDHLEAGDAFLEANHLSWRQIDLVGMHGQTVLHERPGGGRNGRTVQLGDGQWLAAASGLPVAFDFRAADVAAGGEGAPVAPIYHLARARASGLAPPLAVLNVGGVANVTFWSGEDQLTAFDTGPGNGMIDLLVQARTSGRYDEDGKYAGVGRVDEIALNVLLSHPYFEAPPPKSLDRYDFSLEPLDRLELEDACATLTAFAAEALKLGFARMGGEPTEVIVCGGGRHNPALMKAFAERLPVPVRPAEDHGWRGDAIEAEAIAYLAARCAKALPITFPTTTGAPQPLTGGRIAHP
jgi:anhydro-N-acetylmuramic acid kinase